MSSASVFSGEMTMIANSYPTFFKIFSADPAIRQCFKVGFFFFKRLSFASNVCSNNESRALLKARLLAWRPSPLV